METERQKGKKITFRGIFKGDRVIWMIFFFLCMISIVEVYSASSSLSYRGGNFWSPIIKHGGLLFVGFLLMLPVLNIPCKFFKLAAWPMFIFSLFTLFWVLAAGQSTNGASRWVSFMGIQFQPSEIAKGTLVLIVAQLMSFFQTEKGAAPQAFNYIMIFSTIIIGLILLENMSTAILLAITIFMMMILGRIPAKSLVKTVLILVAIAGLFIGLSLASGPTEEELAEEDNTEMTDNAGNNNKETPKTERNAFQKVFHRFSTWQGRIRKFAKNLDKKEVPPEDIDLDKDAQWAHANIAIATCGIIGKGPGNSVERDFLSQAFSDFIYAIIIEELGLLGAIFVAALYIILLFRTAQIAKRCENNFPAFLAMGLALLLVTQAMFNMMVAVGIAPVTGQPLPLISKGGTSSIINCIYIAMILSVSRSAKKREKSNEKSSEKIRLTE